ncbi:MAG: type II toxin-antitoxin system HicA family toxin [Candidatus Dadabacteria bacterium]|nr:type II toxin-antitoxin system HicA family toxin [Candidatus Dadabacteria bacterium]
MLSQNGFFYHRQGKGDHEIWLNPNTGKRSVVDGKIVSRHFANRVLKNAGVNQKISGKKKSNLN